MVRASIHRKWPYDETCRLYSDDNTTRIHYLASREVRRCRGIYHYRQHPASATHAVSVKRFDYLKAAESMKRQLELMGVSENIMAEYEQQRWLILIDTYMFYHCHANELDCNERSYGLGELERAWRATDTARLPDALKRKFGYRHAPTWGLFRVQEWLYFSLRAIIGRNRK